MLPEWAVALVGEVCEAAGRPEPTVRWRRARRPNSSGVARPDLRQIAVTAGTDPIDQRLTLLHELAHWLVPPAPGRRRRTAHHNRAFYRVAFELYQTHGIPVAEAFAREGGRYPSSLGHARQLGLPGADEVWSARRAALRERARLRRPMRILVPEHVVRLVRDGRWTRCSVCGARVVGPTLARLRRRAGRHILLATG